MSADDTPDPTCGRRGTRREPAAREEQAQPRGAQQAHEHALRLGQQGTRAGRQVARNGSLGAEIAGFPRQALHARRLGFTHPATGQRLDFDSPLPPDMTALIVNLELL